MAIFPSPSFSFSFPLSSLFLSDEVPALEASVWALENAFGLILRLLIVFFSVSLLLSLFPSLHCSYETKDQRLKA